MMIKDMAQSELPRERFIKYGVKSLSNEELLSILLRIGVRNLSVKDVSMNILKSLPNITDLEQIKLNELADIKGVGNVKAMTLIAAVELGRRVFLNKETNKIKINSTDMVYELFKDKFKFVTQEKLMAIYLNNKNQIIEYKTLFIGTTNASVAHPREIFKEAVKLSACGIIIIHNHPSGDPTPSLNDIKITKQIEGTGEIMGIPLIDHIIFGNTTFSSYKEHKWDDYFARVH